MTENTESYSGQGLKGPLYWLAGVVTGKLALSALGGGWGGCGGPAGVAARAANDAVVAELAKKDSIIAKYESEKYTDKQVLDLRDRLAALNEKSFGYAIDIDKRVAALETAAPLREQILLGKIGEVATAATGGIANLDQKICCLSNTVNGIVKTIVPASAVCPAPMPQYNSWTAPTTTT